MPLAGLRVVELAGILAGPLVGQFCAELGADVVKVEPPGGDPTRGWRLPEETDEEEVSAYFACCNRGKRSVVADLRTDDGRNLVRRLLKSADVSIASFRAGADRRYGLDPDTLRAANPRLIDLRVTAYGADDPRPGFDAIVQAEGGFTSLNGEADGGPVKMPVALVDVLAAHQLKEGLLLALLRRERTGQGALVTTSLLASAVASLANQASSWLHAGVVPRRIGSEHPTIVPYGTIVETRDGRELVLAAGTDAQFERLLAALGLDPDERFRDNASRVRRRAELLALLRPALAAHDADELSRRLTDAGVPFGVVNDLPRVFEQDEARRQLFEDGRGVRSVALGGDLEGRRALAPAPRLGEHDGEVWGEVGGDE